MKITNVLIRRSHRVIGVCGVGFLLLITITGLLWAYAPYLYWKDDYKKKKSPPVASPALAEVRVSAGEALALARQTIGGEISFSSLILRADFGRLLHEVQGTQNGKDRVVLLDAVTGEVLSPLNEPRAIAIAREYVPPGFTLEGAIQVDDYVDRNGKKKGAAYIVKFQEGGGREIVVSRSSAQILEDQDRARQFHFWVMRLHQLSFFGFKKELTLLPGALLIVMIVSGLWMWISYQKARRKKGEQ